MGRQPIRLFGLHWFILLYLGSAKSSNLEMFLDFLEDEMREIESWRTR